MTTTIISGTSGYINIQSPVTGVSVTSTGYLKGVAWGYNNAADYTLTNSGRVESEYSVGAVRGFASTAFVTNGAVGGSAADITGVNSWGVQIGYGTVSNFGAIVGCATYDLSEHEFLEPGVKMVFGTVTNGSGADDVAVIQGASGVFMSSAGTVKNFGSILGAATVGYQALGTLGDAYESGGVYIGHETEGPHGALLILGAALVDNGDAGDTGARIQGCDGVNLTSGGTVDNFGTIESFNSRSGGGDGVYIQAGAVINGNSQDSVAMIQGYGDGVRFSVGSPGVVRNFGTIRSTEPGGGNGVVLYDGGQLTNGSSGDHAALVQSYLAAANAELVAATVTNYGTIRSTGKSANVFAPSAGVALIAGGRVSNGSTSDTVALVQGYIGVIADRTASVANFGTIKSTATAATVGGVEIAYGGGISNGSSGDSRALIEGIDGVWVKYDAGTVVNFGTIESAGPKIGKHGVYLAFGGAVTNGTTADAAALIQGYQSAVYVAGAAGTIRNFGTIANTATQSGHAGVSLDVGGYIQNGSASDTVALIKGYQGVVTHNDAATVVNFGQIRSTGLAANRGGVALYHGGAVTNGSASETVAYITGREGVTIETSAGTVTNFGVIASADGGLATDGKHGVLLANGGTVVNGSAGDVKATIGGYQSGVAINSTFGAVHNYGTIVSFATASGQAGAYLADGGVVTNGASAGAKALISGDDGVLIAAGVGLINNYGTLAATGATGGWAVRCTYDGILTNEGLAKGYNGVDLTGDIVNTGAIEATGSGGIGVILAGVGGYLTNGRAQAGGSSAPASISGDVGVLVAGASTVVNFGSIVAGSSGLAVAFLAPGGTLVVEAGGEFAGKSVGDGGTLVLNSGPGTGTLSGLSNGNVTVSGSMAPAAFVGFDTIVVATNSAFSDTGSGAIGAGDTLVDKGALRLGGTFTNDGEIDLDSGVVTVGAVGLSLTGTGVVSLDDAANGFVGASAGNVLSLHQLLEGSGDVGMGAMMLTIAGAGTIELAGSVALTLDTGAATIDNVGAIVAASNGGLAVMSAVDNAGHLSATSGTLTIEGAVAGSGEGTVGAGVLDAAAGSAFDQDVAFTTSATGTFELADGQAYTGTISGFSLTGATTLDLADVAFAAGTTKASYSGNTSGGVLTISDGAKTSKIAFAGNYTNSTWTLSSDGHGGTDVVDPTTAPAAAVATPTTHGFVQASAALAAADAEASPRGPERWTSTLVALAQPGVRTV